MNSQSANASAVIKMSRICYLNNRRSLSIEKETNIGKIFYSSTPQTAVSTNNGNNDQIQCRNVQTQQTTVVHTTESKQRNILSSDAGDLSTAQLSEGTENYENDFYFFFKFINKFLTT